MTGKKFFVLLGVVVIISAVVFFAFTPHGNNIPLIGVVDGNEVIISPQIAGRMIRLTVDEGSEVKKGDLIAELDPSELQAALAQDDANIGSLEAKVNQSSQTLGWMDAHACRRAAKSRNGVNQRCALNGGGDGNH